MNKLNLSQLLPYHYFLLVGLLIMIPQLTLFAQKEAQSVPAPNPNRHDYCEKAIPMYVGMTLSGMTNEQATTGPVSQAPPKFPGTCIQTFENDQWYSFTTTEEYPIYEIMLTYNACNTPAGLQTMLIKAENCNALEFNYVQCVNLENTDTIFMYLEYPEPGVKYFIYVDGFDGAICDYNVSLNALNHLEHDRHYYKYARYSYEDFGEPGYVVEGLEGAFENNMMGFKWLGDLESNVSHYLIEQVITAGSMDPYSKVIGVIDAQSSVTGGQSLYSFYDQRTDFKSGKEYCYRLVEVDPKGNRNHSKPFCATAWVVKSFYVAEVEPAPNDGFFQVKYINSKAKQDYNLLVLNEEKEVLKGMVFKKEPIREGIVTLDMTQYPAGKYYFQMESEDGYFVRSFVKAD